MVLYQGLIVQVISSRNSISLANAILRFSRHRSPTFILKTSKHSHTHQPHARIQKANHIEQTHIGGGEGERRKIDDESIFIVFFFEPNK